ncbi:hypothetical protein C8F04DRAFT_1193856 [Mycena alexandri]|uniref:Uncharacterized protein n=1 Tax=Mycena alexandri TaxID=1745969 RepID=A0AAD6WS55_9AGAR|nr:hypothetical protein C8F04DRAFT_1193856 [Mycena alexandri]
MSPKAQRDLHTNCSRMLSDTLGVLSASRDASSDGVVTNRLGYKYDREIADARKYSWESYEEVWGGKVPPRGVKVTVRGAATRAPRGVTGGGRGRHEGVTKGGNKSWGRQFSP